MKRLLWPLAVVTVAAVLGVAGVLVARSAPPPPAAPSRNATAAGRAPSPAPTITKEAIRRQRATATHRPRTGPKPHVTDPWAVVRAYYRDVQARKYAKAWALIGSGVVTGQTYQQFVAGYGCTGAVQLTKLGESGHRVSFGLAARNDCTGATQYYTGTDTVRGGKIVAADVTSTG